MFNLNKYKIGFYINYNNSINYDKTINVPKGVNYVFKHKNKLFRNFILIYSTFLNITPYSNILYKTNPEYNINFRLFYFLIVDNNVILF